MRFYIDKLILWLKKDKNPRFLQFKNDKINIITGNSKTGKTAILEIIDYCFCGSADTVVISHERIGENVSWYGLKFYINDKEYTIARGAISIETGEFSDEYFFSQTGEIPNEPTTKMKENELKKILEKEFGIEDEIMISHGGKGIRKNTRLSFRYFLLFNTLSKDIIDNGTLFFDKLTIDRYQTVWPQIFDLSMNIVTMEYFEITKEIKNLENEIYSIEQQQKKYDRKKKQYENKKELLVKHAKEYMLIDEKLENERAFKKIEDLIKNAVETFGIEFSEEQEYSKYEEEQNKYKLQLMKLKKFKSSYELYRKKLREEADSLSPVDYIINRYGKNLDGEYLQFLEILRKDFTNIKRDLNSKRPFEYSVNSEIKKLQKQIKYYDEILEKKPKVNYYDMPIAQKLINLGEIKSEYKELISNEVDDYSSDDINGKKEKLDELNENDVKVRDRRKLVIDTLDDYIQEYIRLSKDALGEYGDFIAKFDYNKKRLTLKHDKQTSIAQISSSSDHLFMHLCLFAGMHEMLTDNHCKFVPSFLIMDQPSRPYFNNDVEHDYKDSKKMLSNKEDWSKVKMLFSLWDSFMNSILEKNHHFQLIILEHVPEDAWKECKNVNLVDVFDGISSALIPPDYYAE